MVQVSYDTCSYCDIWCKKGKLTNELLNFGLYTHIINYWLLKKLYTFSLVSKVNTKKLLFIVKKNQPLLISI